MMVVCYTSNGGILPVGRSCGESGIDALLLSLSSLLHASAELTMRYGLRCAFWRTTQVTVEDNPTREAPLHQQIAAAVK